MKLLRAAQALRDKGCGFAIENRGEDPEITGVFSDSRKILPGSIFCCIKGEKNDGHDYASAAEASGAAALVCERPVKTGLPTLFVPSARKIMGELSSIVYGKPSSRLLMVGVTGTNGKSTTAYVLRSILRAAGVKTGLLGTIVEDDGVQERDAERTTPESCDVQRQLAAMVNNGCGACVMEASSHGLQLGRLDGCRFDVAVFTNLNPDHLDFHLNMENYFQAKRLLFTKYSREGRTGAANKDDPYGIRLMEEIPGVRGFGASNALSPQLSLDGFSLAAVSDGEPLLELRSPLTGNFNVLNTLAAVTALRGRFSDAVIAKGVADTPQTPGRLEKYFLPNGACCVIDFAHTPEALRSALSTVREFCQGRLISIFGHGGGRYASNRPALGEAAAELADLIFVTMDNPRDENPASIAEAIVRGVENKNGEQARKTHYQVILDRKAAIAAALSAAGPKDVLVISGKGPEKFLTIGSEKIPYNDAETVKEWIRRAG